MFEKLLPKNERRRYTVEEIFMLLKIFIKRDEIKPEISQYLLEFVFELDPYPILEKKKK